MITASTTECLINAIAVGIDSTTLLNGFVALRNCLA